MEPVVRRVRIRIRVAQNVQTSNSNSGRADVFGENMIFMRRGISPDFTQDQHSKWVAEYQRLREVIDKEEIKRSPLWNKSKIR